MIVNDTHIRCYDFCVLDIVTQKIISKVKSFDTITNDAIVYETEIINKVNRCIIKDGETVLKTINLPNCILLDTKNKTIVK